MMDCTRGQILKFLFIENEICGMSPDPRDCQWMMQNSSVLTISQPGKVVLHGFASGFSTCNGSSSQENASQNHFGFIPIRHKKTLKWLAKHIRSGECPHLFDF